MATDQELKARELDIRDRELLLKAEELADQRKRTLWWSAPLTIAVVGGLIALVADYFIEGVKGRQTKETHMLGAALDLVRVAAAPGNSVEQTRKFLRFVIDVDIGPPDLRQKLEAYLNKPDAPLPSVAANREVVAPSTAPGPAAGNSAAAPPSNQPGKPGEVGWFYLGRADTKNDTWAVSSAVGTFEVLSHPKITACPDKPTEAKATPVVAGQAVGKPLDGKLIRTLAFKYLRDSGVPGQRVRSPVKRTLDPGTMLRIISVDDLGRDDGLPVLWAEVEVCEGAGA